MFYVHDFTHRTVDINTAIGFDPAYRRSYEEHYVSQNVFLIHGKELLQPGLVGPTTRLCPDSVLTRSELFNEWSLPQGMCHGINASVLRTQSLVGLFGVSRELGAPLVDDDDLALVSALMPHLRRAVQLHQRFTELETRQRAAVDALNGWPLGIIVLDRRGRALLMNRSAGDLLNRRDGLTLTADGLEASQASETRRLRALIYGAMTARNRPGAHPGGVMLISRSNARRPLHLLAAPLPEQPSVSAVPPVSCLSATPMPTPRQTVSCCSVFRP